MKTKTQVLLLPSLLLALLSVGADPGSEYPRLQTRDLALISEKTQSKPPKASLGQLVTLRPAPHKIGDIATDSDWNILPRSDLYELGASKLELSSIRDLPENGFRVLTEPEARRLVGEFYRCPAGKLPYLMRAVFAKGSCGGFRVERCGSRLAIIWGQLFGMQGPSESRAQSAVVVNLDFKPNEIYTEFSSVM